MLTDWGGGAVQHPLPTNKAEPANQVSKDLKIASQSQQSVPTKKHHITSEIITKELQTISVNISNPVTQCNSQQANLMIHSPSPSEAPATPSKFSNISPIMLDEETQRKGQELQKVLQLFKQSTSEPLSVALLQTPQSKQTKTMDLAKGKKNKNQKSDEQELAQRKSPRLKEKNKEGKSTTKLAHDLIVKKCGIINEDDTKDDLTLQQYLDLYKKPLSEPEMEAILELIEVAKEKKKKKHLLKKE
jgi:hypothetical protein